MVRSNRKALERREKMLANPESDNAKKNTFTKNCRESKHRCRGKRRYPTKGAAKNGIKFALENFGLFLEMYLCVHCAHYHLTSEKSCDSSVG